MTKDAGDPSLLAAQLIYSVEAHKNMARQWTFWSRIEHLKKETGHNAIYREYLLPAMERKPVSIPTRLDRTYKLAVEMEKLYWDADYHGLDCNGKSCSCQEVTHRNRTYPALWRRLERLERLTGSRSQAEV